MVSNHRQQLRLNPLSAIVLDGETITHPRISGIRDAGSVDIDASSRNTTGNSTSFIPRLPEVMQVVQT